MFHQLVVYHPLCTWKIVTLVTGFVPIHWLPLYMDYTYAILIS